jgi:hypothetical protein
VEKGAVWGLSLGRPRPRRVRPPSFPKQPQSVRDRPPRPAGTAPVRSRAAQRRGRAPIAQAWPRHDCPRRRGLCNQARHPLRFDVPKISPPEAPGPGRGRARPKRSRRGSDGARRERPGRPDTHQRSQNGSFMSAGRPMLSVILRISACILS